MNTEILTNTLHAFVSAFDAGYTSLQPAIQWLIGTMLTIEVVMIGLWWALGGGERLVSVMKKLMYLLVWLWIVQNFQDLAKTFVWSLAEAGEIAGGQVPNHKLLTDPSAIVNLGLKIGKPLADQIGMAGWNVGNSIAFAAMWLLSGLAFLIIGWQIFYALLEFYLIVTLTAILMPFGFFEPTKFLAEKSIGAVISSGVKLMVLSFIVAVGQTILTGLPIPTGVISLETGLMIVLISGAIAFLAWNGPGVAAGLVAGSPALSAGTGLQNAVAGGVVAGGAMFAAAAGGKYAATKLASLAGASGKVSTKSGQMGVLNSAGGAAGSAVKNSTKVAGEGMKKAGEGVSAAGGGMKAAGGSIAATPVPVVSQVAGGAVTAAGVATDVAGKGITATGAAVEKTGEAAGEGIKSAGKAADKVSKSPEWASKAMHVARQSVPDEARPSGGNVNPKL